MQPTTQYARRGSVNIAFQVVGDGPVDVLFAPGFVSHVDVVWTDPAISAFMRRLAAFCRLILFDKPGTGASDPVAAPATLEERVQDVLAVLDAAGSERAALVGLSEGGTMSAMFAASYPGRTRALVLLGSFARFTSAPAYFPENQQSDERRVAWIRQLAEDWGTGRLPEMFAPGLAGNAVLRSAWALFERAAASPAMVQALIESVLRIDIRDVLPTIAAPTLVIHRTGDHVVPVEYGRYLAQRIPGARFVELPGDSHVPWLDDVDTILDEIEEFVTGARQAREPQRVLATVLFTDIVGSTERAAELGDRRWRELLERHHAVVRAQLDRFGGREINTTGDGFLAAFHGPAAAIRCATSINAEIHDLGIATRAGVHTGECEQIGTDLGGLAVHIGARVSAQAAPGEVLASSTVKDLVVGSEIEFVDRGRTKLKGVPGEWRVFAATPPGAENHDTGPGAGGERFLKPHGHVHRGDRIRFGLAKRMPNATRAMLRVAGRYRRNPAD